MTDSKKKSGLVTLCIDAYGIDSYEIKRDLECFFKKHQSDLSVFKMVLKEIHVEGGFDDDRS